MYSSSIMELEETIQNIQLPSSQSTLMRFMAMSTNISCRKHYRHCHPTPIGDCPFGTNFATGVIVAFGRDELLLVAIVVCRRCCSLVVYGLDCLLD